MPVEFGPTESAGRECAIGGLSSVERPVLRGRELEYGAHGVVYSHTHIMSTPSDIPTPSLDWCAETAVTGHLNTPIGGRVGR